MSNRDGRKEIVVLFTYSYCFGVFQSFVTAMESPYSVKKTISLEMIFYTHSVSSCLQDAVSRKIATFCRCQFFNSASVVTPAPVVCRTSSRWEWMSRIAAAGHFSGAVRRATHPQRIIRTAPLHRCCSPCCVLTRRRC